MDAFKVWKWVNIKIKKNYEKNNKFTKKNISNSSML
jgi:hypothetical protein